MATETSRSAQGRTSWLRAGIMVLAGALAAHPAAAAGTTFTENWTGSTSPFFTFLPNGGSTITSNAADSAAGDGKIVQLTLPAFASSSPNGGPNLQSTDLYGFGTYETRMKTADCSAQPNTGIVSGFFTYLNDGQDLDGNGVKDNSEIDFEILCAEPNAMWLTMWTDFQDTPLAMKRVYREIDLATGAIRRTCYSEGYGTCTQDLTGSATEGQPATITPISGFNSATAYYTYGFTWLTNRMTWYIVNPASGAKIVLWDYQGPKTRITQRPAFYMFNEWYTPNWPPTNIPGAVEQPNSSRFVKIDYAKYTVGTPGPTPTPCGSCTPTATAPPAPTCYPAWVSNITYQAGQRVTYNGNNYQANFGTNGDNPAVHSGPAGSGQPWLALGPCTSGPTPTAAPTATSTTPPRATATSTTPPRATPTATARARATATATTPPRATATATTPPRATPTSGGGNCAGASRWVAGNSYSAGQLVTYVYQAGDNNPNPGTVGATYEYKCMIANNNPTWTPGIAGPSVWQYQLTCSGGGGATPTATPRSGPTPTPTSPARATPTSAGATPTSVPGATLIHWSGRDWDVRSGGGGPGPNNWDPRNAFVDGNGYLHLQITNRAGTWSSTEIQLHNQLLGFGTYQFHMLGRPDLLDPNTVFGFYLYPPAAVGPDGTNEIDIEFSRWGNVNAYNGNYTVWPAVTSVPRSWSGFSIAAPSNNQSTHRFIWTPTTVTFQSMNGFNALGNAANLYASWVFDPAHPPNPTETASLQFYCSSHDPNQCIAQNPQYFLINMWQFSGQVPTSGTTQEVVLTDFSFSAN